MKKSKISAKGESAYGGKNQSRTSSILAKVLSFKGAGCIVILIFAFCILNFMGCATYKFQLGKKPYDKGYVVSRDGSTILEYTIGKDNNVPDLELARERFKKRRNRIEHYYKKMGYIENRFKMAFWDPCILFIKGIGGVFRLPFVAVSDYKYEHNPKYREKIIKKEKEQDAKEEARVQKLKDTLNIYIQKELTQETNLNVESK